MRNFSLFFVGVLTILFQSVTLSAASLTDLRFWSAPDHTRVVLDLTESVQYKTSIQENPPQFHLDLEKVTLLTKKREVEVNDPFLSRIILTELKKGRARLLFIQKKHLNATVFLLKPCLDKPHRLVIDLFDISQEKKEQEERRRQKEIRPKGIKIIVIDPGHGGEDPGAIGPHKTMEKDVVLEIGKKVTHLLNQQNEFKGFLTRKGDYFIPLEERIKIARDYGADLFISLHTDGSFNRQVRGSSLYCLSLSGATDQAAKLLAEKENVSNILGGAILRPAFFSKDPKLNQILLDLMQNNSMKESFRFAELALGEIKDINQLKYHTYRQANFVVLRAPDIPSVLVETAFITNKDDERLLNKNEFQEKFAKTLVNAIKRYFKDYQ
ncbi:MAG: N-acetylmuramoyl-L-alanine amidase [Thermodesulfobacteriota bacterium]|nr:N-acetylmuramoyl-L-alanine amidase [Thermodesulfobacteriota bacterium]